MRGYLLAALVLILGLSASCENLDQEIQENRDPYYILEVPEGMNNPASGSYFTKNRKAQEDVILGEKTTAKKKYDEDVIQDYEEFDPYKPRDEVAYWESIYGTEDIPDFDVPPAIDGETIFMGLDDLVEENDEEAIIGIRNIEKASPRSDRTSSSVKKKRNLENLRSSGNSDYRSVMTDVHQPGCRDFKSYSIPEKSQDSSDLEQSESAWPSNNVRKSKLVDDSEDMDTEVEFTGRYPVTVESRSIRSNRRTDSMMNSKRRVIQAKKDLINVAACGGSKAEVNSAVHRTIDAKKDFIDSMISAKNSAIQHKKELLHSITGLDDHHGHFENCQISGSMGNVQSVADSRHKVIQAKKNLIHASAVGNTAELNDAVIKTLDAKKDLVDSLLSHRQSSIHDKKESCLCSTCSSLNSNSQVSSLSRLHKAGVSCGLDTLQDEKSSLHSSIGETSNIAIGVGIEAESSSSHSHQEKDSSFILNKKIESDSRISSSHHSQSSSQSSSKLRSDISIGGEIGIGSSSSHSNHEKESSLIISKKIESSSQISTSSQLGLIESQSKDDTSESSDQVNSSEAENSETKIAEISSRDSSSEEIGEDITEVQSGSELSGFINTEHEQKTEVHKNIEIKSSTGSEIKLIKNLGDVRLKSGGLISSGDSTQSETKAETVIAKSSSLQSKEGTATIKAAKIFETDQRNDLQSIQKTCAPGLCGITGKLYVNSNTKNENGYGGFHEEPETFVDTQIADDEVILGTDTQSPVTETVIYTELTDARSNEYQEEVEDRLVIDDEEDQQTESLESTKNIPLDDDDGAPSIDEDRERSREEDFEIDEEELKHELESEIDVAEELEEKQDSIVVENPSNSIIRSEISEAEEASTYQNEEEENSSVNQNNRLQVSVKFGHSMNDSSHKHKTSTHETRFIEQCPNLDHQPRKFGNKGKISHVQCVNGHAFLPEDVEEFEADQAFSNAHCRLINLDVNCSGMTAFMKPECQQLNANLWHPWHSDSPINLWTVKAYLSEGQELAIEMQKRAKWLCDQGLVPKLHTPAMLHLINNFATENIVEINQESESSLFGTKLLQRRLSSHFDVTPNTFTEFLQQHPFRVIGTGLCYARQKRCGNNQMYRTFDGSCNNRNNPTWGQSNTAFARVLPARYSDGVHQPPKSVTGSELPNPRVISVRLFARRSIRHPKLTLAIPLWGQMLSHDFAMQTIDQTVEGGIECCADGKRKLPKNLQHHSCFPIEIPSDDKFYSKFGARCMNFVRSMTISREDCTLGPADQLNTVTSYLDASPVYGSNKETCDHLRAFKGGRMLITVRRGRVLLPTTVNRTRFCDIMSPSEVCYRAGDLRVNQNPQLAILQTAFLREHNRIADELTILNPHWEDERVFQETRKIVIAMYQHITYNEWLPLVIGKKYCHRHRLISRHENIMSRDYDPRIKASTINGFTTAAFRFFHSLVDGQINLCPANREISHTLRLSNHYFRPQIIERSNNLDDLIRGMVSQRMQKADDHFDPEITEYLFRSSNEFGLDILSMDIQRGRDHGLPCYIVYRKTCGLPEVKDFDDLSPEISYENIEKLREIYAHVNDIDLIAGIVMENKSSGSLIGPVARCLIGEQFYRSRIGDRYFYDVADQPHSFTKEKFQEIKKASFARLLCDTGDNLEQIQPQAFKIISQRNPLMCCNALPKMDLSAWRESEY